MKVKALHLDPESYNPSQAGQMTRYSRSSNPLSHPLQRAKEYTRAVNAAKLEQMFAKPFVAALEGHNDSVQCMTRSRTHIAPLFTGSADGEIRFWNLAHKNCYKTIRGHQGFVRSMAMNAEDKLLLSSGDDKTVKVWNFDADEANGELLGEKYSKIGALQKNSSEHTHVHTDMESPVVAFHSPSMISGLDAHSKLKNLFATCGEGTLDLWNLERPGQAVQTFEWNVDGLIAVKFNLSEDSLMGVTAQDNSVMLFDSREKSAVRKLVLKNRSNALCWHPRNPNVFTVANEDSNLYSFDIRRFDQALHIYKGHVQAVCDVDYNPTGEELVSAGYDKTLRLFKVDRCRSVNAYHTKRMQRVHTTRYSGDGRFIVSGSEDGNVRVWKAKANMKLGTLSDREKQAMAYRERLTEKFQKMEEIKKINRTSRLPKWIKNEAKKKSIMESSARRKEGNRVQNTTDSKWQTKAKDVVRREEA